MAAMLINKDELKNTLEQVGGTLKWVALLTPTKVDDVVVSKFNELLEYDWFISLLAFVLSKFENGKVDENVVKKLQDLVNA